MNRSELVNMAVVVLLSLASANVIAESADVSFTVTGPVSSTSKVFGVHRARFGNGNSETVIARGTLDNYTTHQDETSFSSGDSYIDPVGVTEIPNTTDCTLIEGKTNATFEDASRNKTFKNKTRHKAISSMGCFVGCIEVGI